MCIRISLITIIFLSPSFFCVVKRNTWRLCHWSCRKMRKIMEWTCWTRLNIIIAQKYCKYGYKFYVHQHNFTLNSVSMTDNHTLSVLREYFTIHDFHRFADKSHTFLYRPKFKDNATQNTNISKNNCIIIHVLDFINFGIFLYIFSRRQTSFKRIVL